MICPELLLRVETDYFVAGAVWQKIYGIWSCVKTAPILRWMKGMSTHQAKNALLKMGAKFQWVEPHDKRMGSSRSPAKATQKRQGTNPDNRITNPSSGDAGKDTARSRGVPIVTDGRLVNNAAGLPPVQAHS